MIVQMIAQGALPANGTFFSGFRIRPTVWALSDMSFRAPKARGANITEANVAADVTVGVSTHDAFDLGAAVLRTRSRPFCARNIWHSQIGEYFCLYLLYHNYSTAGAAMRTSKKAPQGEGRDRTPVASGHATDFPKARHGHGGDGNREVQHLDEGQELAQQ